MSDTQPEETKNEKFHRVGGPRIDKAEYHIGLLKNLAGKDYENTPGEAEVVVGRLLDAVRSIAVAFDVEHLMDPDAVIGLISEIEALDPSREQAAAPVETAAVPVATAPVPIPPNGQLPANFPNEAEDMELLRIGPVLGSAFEDLIAGQSENALSKIKSLMSA